MNGTVKPATEAQWWAALSQALHSIAKDFRKQVKGKPAYDFSKELHRLGDQALLCSPSPSWQIVVEEVAPTELGWIRIADRVWLLPDGTKRAFAPNVREVLFRPVSAP